MGSCNSEDMAFNISLRTNNFIKNYALFLDQSAVYQHITVPFETRHPTIVCRIACPVRGSVRWTSTDLRSFCNINWNAGTQQVTSSNNPSPSHSFLGWGETESTWYVGHYLAYCASPGYRWRMWSSRWNENWQGKPKSLEKTCSSATLSTPNPIWTDLGLNPGRRGGKPATDRLSYDTTSPLYLGCDLVKCRPGHQQFWLRFFVVVVSYSRQMPGYYFKLGHDASVHIFATLIPTAIR
jgi:hypothetical protein